MATAIVPTTLPEALATAMELDPAQRCELERWLAALSRGGIALDPASVRESTPAQIGMLLGTRTSERATWEDSAVDGTA